MISFLTLFPSHYVIPIFFHIFFFFICTFSCPTYCMYSMNSGTSQPSSLLDIPTSEHLLHTLVPCLTWPELVHTCDYNQQQCYGRRGSYFIFTTFPCQLYTSLSFLLQWFCHCSCPRISQRSRHPDLDLQYDFPSRWTISFPMLLFIAWSFFLPFHS